MSTTVAKPAKIGFCTFLKSVNYFRFVPETIAFEATTFLSSIQNLVKIGKELRTQSFDNRSVDRHTHRDRNQTDYIVCQNCFWQTSTIVFYRTRVYQMQPRNGQNWHSFVGKYVHQNRVTAKIGFCTSLKSISISYFVDTRDKVNAD